MHKQDAQLLHSSSVYDGSLVRQSLAGDQSAFETLVHLYDVRLLGYIHHCLGRYGEYELTHDVLQYVLLQFYRSLPTLSTSQSLKPWLFRVAYNRCIDELRFIRRIHLLQFSELDTEINEEGCSPLALLQDTHPLPEDVVEQHEFHQEIYRAIETLPPKYRSVILLRYVHEMSFREIAQTLKMREATVRTYFHRACPLLRTALTLS